MVARNYDENERILAEKRAALKARYGVSNDNEITDRPFSVDDRPRYLPESNTNTRIIETGGYNNRGSKSKNNPTNNNTRQASRPAPFPLVQLCVPYVVDEEKQISVPVLTDYYYNPSARDVIKHFNDWNKSHANLESQGIEYNGKRYPYYGKNNDNELVQTFNDTRAQLSQYIALVEDGQIVLDAQQQALQTERAVYVDKIPLWMGIAMIGMLCIIAMCIILLYQLSVVVR